MRIGVYGSSFDPVTYAHLFLANTSAQRAKLSKVIFVPSSSKRPDKMLQTSDQHRLNMLGLAVAGNPLFEVSDRDIKAHPWEAYTVFTMRYFRNLYPGSDLYFVMGADLLVDIADGKWKHADELLGENKFIVMARNGIDMLKVIAKSGLLRKYDVPGKYTLIDKGFDMEISSSYLRDEIAMGGEPRYLLPDACYEYIVENRLYRGRSE